MTCSKVKGPTEVLDYEEDWNTVLSASDPVDTIATSTWTATNGVVVDSDTHADGVSRVWLSAGSEWGYSNADCTITTTGGRTYARRLVLEIRPR